MLLSPDVLVSGLAWLVLSLLLLKLVQNYAFLRQNHLPGHWLARFTNLDRLFSVANERPHEEQHRLHKQYGDFVQLGPNVVSVRGQGYVSQIYGIGKGLTKSDYYSTFQNIVNGKRTASLVAMTDESDHARTKRAIAHAYSLTTLVEFEPLVDSTIRVCLENLSTRFANAQKVCDLGQYLQYFAFDVIGELTFSKRLGFIENNEDVDGIIAAIGANFRYFSVLGQMPWLDEYLGKNPIYIKYLRRPVSSPILIFAQKLLNERLCSLEGGKESEKEEALGKPDFLSRFLQARKDSEEPELMNDGKLLSYLFMNINAGSDTIASTLRAIFYHLLMDRASLERLMDELEHAAGDGRLSLPCPTWHETQNLYLLPSVIKEGLRINPALSLPLERYVPPSGLNLQSPDPNKPVLCLPSGTIVGINPYVQHRDTRIFGSDAEVWNPDRWLSDHELQHKTMEHSLLAFGAGKRSCLGKNIAMLELHKVVPAVLLRFKMEIVDGGKDWVVKNKWVLDQKGLKVRIGER